MNVFSFNPSDAWRTRMHRLIRGAVIGGILAISLLGTSLGAVAASTGSGVIGHVYVNNNTAGHNTVSGFDRHADGTLTAIAGTPFDAGGAGTGSPIGSAGALQLSGDGRYLLAVDAAANDISVLKVRPDGSLRLVDETSSNGTTPVSIAVHQQLVYVANTGAGGSNYTGFRLNAGGHLSSIQNSTVSLPDTALPGQVLFSGDGRHLVGTRVGPSAGPSFIDSFSVGADGRLTPAPGSPFPAQKIGPFGSQFRPTNPDQLFVSNAHDGGGNGTVSVYDVASDGTLTAIAGSPFADFQTAPCWVAISHDGAYLYAINTGSSSVSSYGIGAGGTLSLIGSTVLSGTGLRPFDAALDPGDSYLYVVDAGVARITVFAVDGGTLSELASSPVAIPGGGAPFGIVVD
ncbi:MAG: lactonase family protein [Chloroflexi bacterium]|nr:MAG: lactonase family protein [Chloroflexota bacterium]